MWVYKRVLSICSDCVMCTLPSHLYVIAGDPRRDADLIVTRDWNGPNSGVILIKNSDFSRWLLKEWWDQDRFVKGNWPYHYEQASSWLTIGAYGWASEVEWLDRLTDLTTWVSHLRSRELTHYLMSAVGCLLPPIEEVISQTHRPQTFIPEWSRFAPGRRCGTG